MAILETWEYRVESLDLPGWGDESARRLEHRLNQLGKQGWRLIVEDRSHLIFIRPTASPPPPSQATALTLTINKGAETMGFTVDTTDGVATMQFTDDHGDAVAAPLDSVTAAPILPTVVSDDTAVITVAATVADPAIPGKSTAALTPAGIGSANLSVSPLTNSDGSPVLETAGANAGQPFALAAPVPETVEAGPAGELTFAVTG